jgi:NAD(P)-dependent dehydrogenase (short-subunit alcohol dehydrogenase family)
MQLSRMILNRLARGDETRGRIDALVNNAAVDLVGAAEWRD